MPHEIRTERLRLVTLGSGVLRAVVLGRESRVIGVTGIHGRPGAAPQCDGASDGVEFGYTIFAAERRNGYAAEASAALIAWAAREHGVRTFALSIAPDNRASLAVAAKLGFERVGERVHAERGLEEVYRKTIAAAETR